MFNIRKTCEQSVVVIRHRAITCQQRRVNFRKGLVAEEKPDHLLIERLFLVVEVVVVSNVATEGLNICIYRATISQTT